MTFGRMSAMLVNPHTLTGTVYANQQQSELVAADRVIYSTEGNKTTTSDNLTYNGTTLALTGDLNTTGDLNVMGDSTLIGNTQITGNIGQTGQCTVFGTVSVANSENPFTSNQPGPSFYYRNVQQPVIWNGFAVVNSQNLTTFEVTINVDGPYVGTAAFLSGYGVNGNPSANQRFYVEGLQITNAAGQTLSPGEKIGRLRFRCYGENTNPAQINYTILFSPL